MTEYQGRRGTVFLFHHCLTHSPQRSPCVAIVQRHIQPIPCQIDLEYLLHTWVKHIQHSPSSMLSTWCIACIRTAFGGGCISLLVFKELQHQVWLFVSYQFLPFLVLSAAFRDFSSALRAFSSAFRAFSSSLSFAFLAFL